MIPKQQQQQQQQQRRKFNKLESILFPTISSDLENRRSSTTSTTSTTKSTIRSWKRHDDSIDDDRNSAYAKFRYTPSVVVSDISYSSEENDHRSGDDALFDSKPTTTTTISTTEVPTLKTAVTNTTHMKDVTRLSPKIRGGYNEEMSSIFSDTTSYSSSPLTPHQLYHPNQPSPPLSPRQPNYIHHHHYHYSQEEEEEEEEEKEEIYKDEEDKEQEQEVVVKDTSSMHKPLHYLNNPATLDHYNNHPMDKDSFLLKKALKSPISTSSLSSASKRRSFTVYNNNKKRRESIGGDVSTRRRPVSTSIIPRLTKSSIISTDHQHHNRIRARSSLRSISQMDKDILASINDVDDNGGAEGSDQWDPHIDAFEILRAKITGITRSMQEFHVQELFHEELFDQKKKQKKKQQQQQQLLERNSFVFPTTSLSNGNSSRLLSAHSRRFSLAAFRPIVSDVNNVVTPHVSQSLGHRRIKSHSSFPFSNNNKNNNSFHLHHQQQQQQQQHLHQDSNSIKDNDIEPYHTTSTTTTTIKENGLNDLADYRINAWSQSEEDDAQQEQQQQQQKEYINDTIYNYNINEEDEVDDDEVDGDGDGDEDLLLSPSRSITSPNLTALFLTTNNLIHSRLDELSETASIASSFHNEEEYASSLEWRQNFLNLVTACIHQSEQLESLSTDVLNTEQRVRELMILNETVNEQFDEREKQYEERIRECQDVAQQQLLMIDSLEELTADINMKIEQINEENDRKNKEKQQQNGDDDDMTDDENDDDSNLSLKNRRRKRWDFKKSVADILHLQDKSDIVQKMRWDIGMFIGAGVGTGHVIHSFQGNLNSFDLMIAGTGRTQQYEEEEEEIDDDGDDFLINGEFYYDDDYYSDEEDISNISGSSSRRRRRSRLNHHLQHQRQLQLQQSRRVRETFSISPTIHHVKFFRHNYVLHLTNKERRTRFALLPKMLWIPDNQATQCQYQYRTVNSRKRGRQCQTKFTFFQRRHHCRRCGYIICQRHSSNQLPLFSSINSYSTAIWSRVCDNCFRYLIMQ